ncbi:MAG: virulence associated protein C [uncultured bacterium]|nr:MAG: virulence associated protein C [uncultured bacterium]OGT33823.1 MAG: hypothetical protein A3C44_04220 [Gammaproteobacteria bacterium RIFCSPHIGHO2_02_FULL_39_13]OGT48908.1 MAG: hypothetical protein A3E53_01270 [Gammaproteobacteria bacterium RIFCSPHIGHO2_12_FULL_39_24]
MKYMLDTNICIYIMKQEPVVVAKKFESFHIGDIVVSSVALSELAFGAYNSQRLEKNLSELKEFMQPIEILSYDENAAYHYGELRAHLKRNGTPVGHADMLIAAHAISINATLITNNLKEFSRIKNVKCKNWI